MKCCFNQYVFVTKGGGVCNVCICPLSFVSCRMTLMPKSHVHKNSKYVSVAPAGNRTRGPTMATLDFATKPLVLMSTYDNLYYYKSVQSLLFLSLRNNQQKRLRLIAWYLVQYLLQITRLLLFINAHFPQIKGMFPFISSYIKKVYIQVNMILCWGHINLRFTFSLSDHLFRSSSSLKRAFCTFYVSNVFTDKWNCPLICRKSVLMDKKVSDFQFIAFSKASSLKDTTEDRKYILFSTFTSSSRHNQYGKTKKTILTGRTVKVTVTHVSLNYWVNLWTGPALDKDAQSSLYLDFQLSGFINANPSTK